VVGSVSLLEIFKLDVLVTDLAFPDRVPAHHLLLTLSPAVGHLREPVVDESVHEAVFHAR
jgi:hypothetical protein